MARRKRNVKGSIYLLHFHRPLKHARHYTGWAKDVVARVREHQRGCEHSSRLMQAVIAAGIGFDVVRVWTGKTRIDERQMKKHGAGRRCPICTPEVTR